MEKRFCLVGAGFSCAVIARALAEAGCRVLVVDERNHLAGNCHSERDAQSGIMIHRYGPHIFHTDSRAVWDYICQFSKMMPYTNRVKAIAGGKVYTLPINLLTINQFFGLSLNPADAYDFLKSQSRSDIVNPVTFEEQALRFIGDRLYRAFFYGYTKKQWGVEPSELPASVLKRLPIRFNYDDNYFSHTYQGIPFEGYTEIVSKILLNDNIEVRLNCQFEALEEDFRHIIYSGPIDRYFGYRLGRLGYRSLEFREIRSKGDFQGAAVINYCDENIPFTRISEHKHFSPWESSAFEETICFEEYSKPCSPGDAPYYPIRLANEKKMISDYVSMAELEEKVSFVGRLGTYRYLDMDVTIGEALETAAQLLHNISQKSPIPTFFHRP